MIRLISSVLVILVLAGLFIASDDSSESTAIPQNTVRPVQSGLYSVVQ
jgi:hypothetical protein